MESPNARPEREKDQDTKGRLSGTQAGNRRACRSILLLLCLACIISGCGPSLRYNPAREGSEKAGKQDEQRVAVAEFTDCRPPEERVREARESAGQSHEDDYTYDTGWREGKGGIISAALTEMVVDHLGFSEVFAEVTEAPFTSEGCDCEHIQALASEGIDAVLCGDIEHFYGYAEDHEVKAICIIIGTLGVGGLVYLAMPQPTTGHTDLAGLELISTDDCEVLWEGSAEGLISERRVWSTDKHYDYARESLAMAASAMVRQFSSPYIPGGRFSAVLEETTLEIVCPDEIPPTPAQAGALRQAREALFQGAPERSIAILTEVVREDPRCMEAQALLQDCWLLHHGDDDPETLLDTSLSGLADTDPLGVILHARALREAGRTEEALADLDELATLLPACPMLLVERADALRRAGKIAEATENYEKAIEIDPGCARGHEALALIYILNSPPDVPGAKREAVRAMDLRPDGAAPHALLAAARYRGGERGAALDGFRAAVRKDPHDLLTVALYNRFFPFDAGPPTDLLIHPTGYSLETGELTLGFLGLGQAKYGIPGGVTVGTNTLQWILKEPNALLKLRLMREATYLPAVAIDGRYRGNIDVEHWDHHVSEFQVFVALSKRLLPSFSLHMGAGRVFQDRGNPIHLDNGDLLNMRELQGFLAFDFEIASSFKLLLEPYIVRFHNEEIWDWGGAMGFIWHIGVARLKLGTVYMAWDDDQQWYPAVGFWWGR